MCDWEAGEYAEYLLWVEAAEARARVRAIPDRVEASVEGAETPAPEPVSIAA